MLTENKELAKEIEDKIREKAAPAPLSTEELDDETFGEE